MYSYVCVVFYSRSEPRELSHIFKILSQRIFVPFYQWFTFRNFNNFRIFRKLSHEIPEYTTSSPFENSVFFRLQRKTSVMKWLKPQKRHNNILHRLSLRASQLPEHSRKTHVMLFVMVSHFAFNVALLLDADRRSTK